MPKTAINLYSVRELDEPLHDVLERVAAAGYDGVQFAGEPDDADPAAVLETLDETGLEPTAAHVGIEALEDDLEAVYDLYAETLGCDGAVVPYLDDGHFASAEAVAATADRLDSIAAAAADRGWSIHYHNHAHEFVDLGDETAFERFAEAAENVGIELDVGWALVGGSDPVELIDAYGDRIDLLHMKDMATDEERGFREIGEGDVDMQECANAAREADVEWLVYEHDEPADPAASIDAGAAFLASL